MLAASRQPAYPTFSGIVDDGDGLEREPKRTTLKRLVVRGGEWAGEGVSTAARCEHDTILRGHDWTLISGDYRFGMQCWTNLRDAEGHA